MHTGVVRAFDEAWQLDKANCPKYNRWMQWTDTNMIILLIKRIVESHDVFVGVRSSLWFWEHKDTQTLTLKTYVESGPGWYCLPVPDPSWSATTAEFSLFKCKCGAPGRVNMGKSPWNWPPWVSARGNMASNLNVILGAMELGRRRLVEDQPVSVAAVCSNCIMALLVCFFVPHSALSS